MLHLLMMLYCCRKVRHKNVIQFLGACTRSPTLCIVTGKLLVDANLSFNSQNMTFELTDLIFVSEFMAQGSIYDFLHKQKRLFKLQTLLKVALDVAKGMCYLHQNNIIHRDLKTANLLMDEHGVRFVLSLATLSVVNKHLHIISANLVYFY